jgi:hypothetical protein
MKYGGSEERTRFASGAKAHDFKGTRTARLKPFPFKALVT